jgi:predicted N-formylglutamate amidohydrolase
MEINFLITCEHGGNRVPRPYVGRFQGKARVLASHRGYDAGSLELARRMANRLGAPLFASTVTRLLVELNRSLGHPRMFSEFTEPLDDAEKQQLVRKYYLPYRQRVIDWLHRATRRATVVHISVHSFTPVLQGSVRTADIGLLYDPRRTLESQFCHAWQRLLGHRDRRLRVRRNYPYLGKSDGLTTALRRQFDAEKYLGIELEINQRWQRKGGPRWRQLQEDIVATAELGAESVERRA